ncbi:hypothetical protein FB382_003757 [Nocardioides ginsengisegetis]|uniref:FtsX-like permease family protein n=1 Tax=Nocardioides ginsengisegetis TaxID=661491 RepID=A0A7W3PBE1_9ACTN|nr:hypothetical protein [Nocardioides ginsengisegetis]MBA8805466.1 hypothetical protein [Nocardioides ginsengisegetis]
MIGALRDGMRARAATHAVLAAVMVVAVSGLVVVLSFAQSAGTSRLLALPLVMLAVIAVPACGSELAAARREELGLARLRGVTGVRLLGLLAAEPLVTLSFGAALGLGLGSIATRTAARAWLHASVDLTVTSTVVGVMCVMVLMLGGVVLAMLQALSEPLPEQVSPVARPRPPSVLGLFVEVLIIVAALVAVYRSRVAPNGDWVTFAGPALVGLAAGQVAVWLVRAVARFAVGVDGDDRVASFLAARRLARSDGVGGALRLVVAAGVVAVLAATGSLSVNRWVDETARIDAGAPLVVEFDGDAQQLLAATHAVDPDGRWLMAAVRTFADDRGISRQVFLDSSRYDAVIGNFLAGTPASEGSQAVRDLARRVAEKPALPRSTRGRWSTTVTAGAFNRTADVALTAEYVGARGVTFKTIRLRIPPGGSRSGSVRLTGCGDGCRVSRLTIAEGRTCTQVVKDLGLCGRPDLRITHADFGGVNLIRQTWHLEGRDDGTSPGTYSASPTALLVHPSVAGQSTLVPDQSAFALQVLASRGMAWDGNPVVKTPGGDARPAEVVGVYPALPVVVTAGTVSDLPQALEDSSPTVPAAQSLVLARTDTPSSVLDALAALGGGEPRTAGNVAAPVIDGARVTQARVYALMAGCCLLLGPLALAIPVTRQRRERRVQVAILRLLRLPPAVIGRATGIELALLGIVGGVGAGAAGLAAVLLLLSRLPLIVQPVNQIPLDTAPRWGAVLAVATFVAVSVLLVGAATRRTDDRRSSPSILREEGR